MVAGADEVGACATGTTAGAAGSTVVLTGGANFIVLGVAAHEKRVLGKWCWWLMLAVFCLFSPHWQRELVTALIGKEWRVLV